MNPVAEARRMLRRDAIARVPWGYYLGFGLGRLAPLVVLPLVSRSGAANLGRFEVALAIMVAGTIVLDAGFGAAIVRFCHGPKAPEVLASAGVLQVAASGAAAVLFVPLMLILGPTGVSTAGLCGVLLAFVLVEGLAVVSSGLIRAEANDSLYFTLGCVRLVLTMSIALVGAAMGAAVLGALAGIALGGLGFAIYVVYRWLLVRRLMTIAMSRRLAIYGIPLMSTTLGLWFLALSDRLFLQQAVSSGELGQYSANYRLGSVILVFLSGPLVLAWLPEAQRVEPEPRASLRRRWAFIFTATCALIGAILVAVAGFVIPAFFGPDLEADRFVVLLVAISGWLGGLYYLLATPVLISESTKWIAVAPLVTVAVTLAMNALLIPAYGGHGAAAATLGSYASLCVMAIVVNRLWYSSPAADRSASEPAAPS